LDAALDAQEFANSVTAGIESLLVGDWDGLDCEDDEAEGAEYGLPDSDAS
jgi:hypothetical protein